MQSYRIEEETKKNPSATNDLTVILKQIQNVTLGVKNIMFVDVVDIYIILYESIELIQA